MGNFFTLRRPLPRRTLVFCHVVAQLGLLASGAIWLAQRTPWLAPVTWQAAWPTLAVGLALLLLAMVATRLLAELLTLPHHVAAALRQGLTPGAIMTRSFERRPAVHDLQEAWVNDARAPDQAAILDEEAVGNARVVRSRQPLGARRGTQRQASERGEDDTATDRPRQEPSF